jgi:hypothetical protein
MLDYTKSLKSVDQIAEENDWSPNRVRTLIHEGLPVVKIGRQNLISERTFDRFLQERETSTRTDRKLGDSKPCEVSS